MDDRRTAVTGVGRFHSPDGARLQVVSNQLKALILTESSDPTGPAWLDFRPAGAETRRELLRVHAELVGDIARLEAGAALVQSRIARQTELARTIEREIGRFHDTVNRNRETFLAMIERRYRAADQHIGRNVDLDAQVMHYFTVSTHMMDAFTASMVRLAAAPRRLSRPGGR